MRIYTVGYGGRKLSDFGALLWQYGVACHRALIAEHLARRGYQVEHIVEA